MSKDQFVEIFQKREDCGMDYSFCNLILFYSTMKVLLGDENFLQFFALSIDEVRRKSICDC